MSIVGALVIPSYSSPLRAALSGDEPSARYSYATYSPGLLRAARRRAPKLAPDLHEEIVAETWAITFARGSAPLTRAKVEDAAYLHSVLRNAAESVKAAYRPAGSRSRGHAAERSVAPQIGPIVEPTECVDCGAPANSVESVILARVELDFALRRMSPVDRVAAAYLLRHDSTIAEAAASVGVARQTFARHLADLRTAA